MKLPIDNNFTSSCFRTIYGKPDFLIPCHILRIFLLEYNRFKGLYLYCLIERRYDQRSFQSLTKLFCIKMTINIYEVVVGIMISSAIFHNMSYILVA